MTTIAPWSTLMFAVLMSMFGCRAEAPAPPRQGPPNVLLISVDTLRRDHVGCYGYARDTTPHLDALAETGAVFDNTLSTSSWTLPAHATMLTGRYPSSHGLVDDGTQLAEGVGTVAEPLRDGGYHTFGTVAHVYVSSEYGLDRGFVTFDDGLLEGGATNPRGDQVTRRFTQLLREAPADQPFFGFAHYFDPHWDYEPPPPFDGQFTDPRYDGTIDGSLSALLEAQRGGPLSAEDLGQLVALYDGEIAYVDAQIGRILDVLEELGHRDHTVVVVTADHGEEFGEHANYGHGKTLYGEQLHVPLIVAGTDRLPAGSRRTEMVSLVDLAPTLRDLATLPADPAAEGRSLLDEAPTDPRTLFAETRRAGLEQQCAQRALLKAFHLTSGDRWAWFDLAEDPGEKRPRRADPSGGALTDELRAYIARHDAGWHLKLVSRSGGTVRVRATVRVEGRIVEPRRLFGEFAAPSDVSFETFELAEDGSSLTFDVSLTELMGEIAFTTDPPGGEVSFDLVVDGHPEAGAFAGTERLPPGEVAALHPTDPGLRTVPVEYGGVAPGCYIRATPTQEAGAEADLSPAARERLEALGYIEGG
jgi:arylsulfatase A-like enzyme